MIIAKDKVVSLVYELRLDGVAGDVIEKVDTDQPLSFIHGAGLMLQKFENNLLGFQKGDKFNFKLITDEAYGPLVDEAIVDIPLQSFMVDGKLNDELLVVDNPITMSDAEGNRYRGIVKEIGKESVTIDFNHPLAGEDLYFDGEIVEVREATEEELAHGHLHGSKNCSEGDCSGCSC